ncbi:MAG: hypothetical protein JWO30_2059 [Fibrobacteres bacterium]|nr:hypothetical protein [Fibrobacterota bacterium]
MGIKQSIMGLAVLVFTACGTDSGEDARSIVGGVYKNNSIGLTISFPSSWQIRKDQTFGSTTADIVAVAPPINNFSPNMSVIIEAHSGSVKMSEILASIKIQIDSHVADLSQYHDSIYSIDGTEVGEMQYESSTNGNLLHFLQLFFIKNGKDVSCTITDKADDFQVNGDIRSVRASISIQ